MASHLDFAWRGALTDEELSALHAAAFAHPEVLEPWTERLERHSLGWMTGRHEGALRAFCNVITDGGRHAFLLDTAVHPDLQGTGVGRSLVLHVIEQCRLTDAEWLHVDFEVDLGPFEMADGLFRRTTAGLLRL